MLKLKRVAGDDEKNQLLILGPCVLTVRESKGPRVTLGIEGEAKVLRAEILTDEEKICLEEIRQGKRL